MVESKNTYQNQEESLCESLRNVEKNKNERVESILYSQFLKSQSENILTPNDISVRKISELLLLLQYDLLLVRKLDGTVEALRIIPQ